MVTTRRFLDGDPGSDMNASLWGELQSFIDLSMIYAKLPLASFFRLRQVCKEWNRLASDREFLEQNFKPPISSHPYFVLTRPSEDRLYWAFEDSSTFSSKRSKSSTLLAFDGFSWTSTPVPRARCEVSGLLFEDSDRNGVFDVHTRVFHTVPPLPPVPQELALRVEEEEDEYKDPLLLMTVDTTQTPYAFKVLFVDEIIGTRIYDSNSGAWTHKPSTYEDLGSAFGTSCVHDNKSLLMRTGSYNDGWFYVVSYDLERDLWDGHTLGDFQDIWGYIDIGMWQGRLFVFAVNNWPDEEEKEESLLYVWEYCSKFEEPRADFDSMPRDLCEWLRGSESLYAINKFCGEHVLFYNIINDEERAVLYNLDQKTWNKIEFAATPMMLKRVRSKEDP